MNRFTTCVRSRAIVNSWRCSWIRYRLLYARHVHHAPYSPVAADVVRELVEQCRSIQTIRFRLTPPRVPSMLAESTTELVMPAW